MHCYFCQKNKKEINFRETQPLSRFSALSGKIKSRKKTGLCRKHQQRLAQAIKRARFMALIPYVKG